MSAEQNIETMNRIVEAINKQDMSTFSELFTSDVVRHDLGGDGLFAKVKGVEKGTNLMPLFYKAMPDLQLAIEDIFATENRLAVHFAISGTHQGEIFGVAPTGKPIKFNAVNLYRLEDGKVAETWQLLDTATFLRQVGKLNI